MVKSESMTSRDLASYLQTSMLNHTEMRCSAPKKEKLSLKTKKEEPKDKREMITVMLPRSDVNKYLL